MSEPAEATLPARPAAAPVNERVATLVNELIRLTLTEGAGHLGDRLRDEAARWRAKETSVVVAAEPNRGKSSLVNALLGEEIVPSGSTSATGAHLVIRYGSERRASVIREGDVPVSVPFDQIARLATAAPSEGIEGVVIELDHPLLATGLVLVDTPGVGGLSQAHGRITLTALAKADALVFLLDPSEPLSQPELVFLARAAERLDRVVFAMVRTDRYPGWRQVADDDRTLIARHAPRFDGAPLVPTSARLAMAALPAEPGAEPDAALLAESGVRDLSDALMRSVVGQVAAVRLANLLRLAATVVEELDAPVRAASAAAEGESEARDVAARTQATHDDLRDAAERLQVEVTDRFNAMRDLANAEFTRLMRDLSTRFDADKGAAPAPGEDLIDLVQAEVRAGCAELTQRLDDEVGGIATDIAVAVGDLDLDLRSLQIGADAIAPVGDVDDQVPDPMLRLRVASAVASGGTGLTMFGKYAAGDPVLAGMMGAGAILAITMAAVNVKMMRRQRDVASLRKQVQTALEGARSEVAPALRQQILAAQRELERAMKATVRRQARDLQARVAEATQLARSDAAERKAAKTDAERRLAAHAPYRQKVDALQTEVARIL
ncbi:MAG: dynamin family protein, partial [Acidimicrobiales bacterium]